MAAILLLDNIRPEPALCLLALLSAIVLVHRVASANLTERQLRVRYVLTLFPSLAFIHTGPGSVVLGSPLQTAGAAFMLGVALVMCVCLYNEWRGLGPFTQ